MKKRRKNKLNLFFPAICGLALIAAGCAAIQPQKEAAPGEQAAKPLLVQAGDVADIQYVCRLANGEIVAATGAIPADGKKSGIFAEAKKPGAVALAALKPDEPIVRFGRPAGLEKEIKDRLARKITGMKKGETGTLELTAEMIPAPDKDSGFARLSTTRTRPREMKMSKQEFKSRIRKDAQVGQTINIDKFFTGKVESVTGQDVVVRLIPVTGGVVKTPFGMERIHEESDGYKMNIDARVGTLVRLGPFIGRIVSVTDKMITIDNRHPFGYEALSCNVTIDGIYKPGDPLTETKKEECKTCK